MTSLRWAAIVASLAVCAACGESDPTQLVVLVESDLDVPAALDAVVVSVDGPEGCTDECLRTLALEGPSSLPLSFGIAPRDGDVRRRVRLVVEGRLRDTVVVSRTVETGFVPNEVRLLVVRLDASCAERAPCEAELTCDRGECVPEDVDVLGLDRIEPGEELQPRDAGPGVDAGDAGVPPDAGDADAGDAGGELPSSCEGQPDGPATIDPDGDGPVAPFSTWCDGEWTLLLMANGRSTRLGYEAGEWDATAPAPFGPTQPTSVQDAMLASYWSLPVAQLRFVMFDDAMVARELPVPVETEPPSAPRPLAAIMRAFDSELGGTPQDWATLVVPTDVSAVVCDRTTIPALLPAAAPVVRIRLGTLLSTDASCAGVLGWIGVGASAGDQAGSCDPSAATAGGARLCGGMRGDRPRFTLVYGRD